ncbi:MAG TPA: hypothetical protein VM450_05965, partial [Thermomicrobiales bacterium]|nr:hypothetical protein [Thermomicrobiales bacterium]
MGSIDEEAIAPSGLATDTLPEQAYWIAFHHVPYIGPARLRRLLDHLGSLRAAWSASETELRGCLEERSLQALLQTRRELDLPAIVATLERDGVRVTTPVDDSYPALLREIGAPPPVLY